MVVKPGWEGRFFEDFEPGDVYRHPLGRTLSEADNTWFTLLTMNTNQIHFNAPYAARSEFGRPLVVSTLTIAIAVGQSVTDITQNVFANLEMDEIKLDAPGVRRRHAVVGVDRALQARVGVASARRDRQRPHADAQPGRRGGLLAAAHVLRLQARRAPGRGRLPGGQDADRRSPVRPLEDVRIVAVEQYGAGPFGSVHLADLGAEVIKIEDPRSGGDVGR